MTHKPVATWLKGDLTAILASDAGLAAMQDLVHNLINPGRLTITPEYAADEQSGIAKLEWTDDDERQSLQVPFEIKQDGHGEDYLDLEWPERLRDREPLFVEADVPFVDFEPVQWSELPPVDRRDSDAALNQTANADILRLSAATQKISDDLLLDLLADDGDDDEEAAARTTPPPKKASLTVDRINGVVTATVRPYAKILDDCQQFYGLLTVRCEVEKRDGLLVAETKRLAFLFDQNHGNGFWSGELHVDLPGLTKDGSHTAEIRPLEPADLKYLTDIEAITLGCEFLRVTDNGKSVSVRHRKPASGRPKEQYVLSLVAEAKKHDENATTLQDALRELWEIGCELPKLRAQQSDHSSDHPMEVLYRQQLDNVIQNHGLELRKELNRRCGKSQHVEDGLNDGVLKLLENPLDADTATNLKSFVLQKLYWEIQGGIRKATKAASRGLAGRGTAGDEENQDEFVGPSADVEVSDELRNQAQELSPEEFRYWQLSQDHSHREIAQIRKSLLTVEEIQEHKDTLKQRLVKKAASRRRKSPNSQTTDNASMITEDAIVDLVAERFRPLQARVERKLLLLLALADLSKEKRISNQNADVFRLAQIHGLTADNVAQLTGRNRDECRNIIDAVLPQVEAAAALIQLVNSNRISEADRAAVATWLIPSNSTADSRLSEQEKQTLGSKVHAQILVLRERCGSKPILGDHACRWLERVVLLGHSSVNVAKSLVSFKRTLPKDGPTSIEGIPEFVEAVWNEQESLVPPNHRVFNCDDYSAWVQDVDQARELAAAADQLLTRNVLTKEIHTKLMPWIVGEKDYEQLRKPEKLIRQSTKSAKADGQTHHYLTEQQLQQIGTWLHAQILLSRGVFSGAARLLVEQAVLLQQPISDVLEREEFQGTAQGIDGFSAAHFPLYVAEVWQSSNHRTLVPETHCCLDVAASLSSV